MRNLFLIILICSFYQVSAQSIIPMENNNYLIINTKTQAKISLDELASSLHNKKIILFGEEHNDSIAHYLQAALTEKLYHHNKGKIVVSFEMWERDVQYIMDEYLNNLIREKNFIKESRAWSNYADYKPILDFAKEKKVPVICANTPARYTNMVTRGNLSALEQLSPCVKKNYLPPTPIQLLSGDYEDKFNEILGGHSMPGVYVYESQNLWDATMAFSILEFQKKNRNYQVIHFNGRFHTDEFLGVTQRLLNAGKKKEEIGLISSFSDNEYNALEHKKLGDFVIITKPTAEK